MTPPTVGMGHRYPNMAPPTVGTRPRALESTPEVLVTFISFPYNQRTLVLSASIGTAVLRVALCICVPCRGHLASLQESY